MYHPYRAFSCRLMVGMLLFTVFSMLATAGTRDHHSAIQAAHGSSDRNDGVSVPKADKPATAVEIRFESDGLSLAGTLHLGPGITGGPAVVAVHGAGSGSREDELFAHLIDTLPPLGIAVFTWDRRGASAAADGYDPLPHYSTLAGDAVAAMRAVAEHPAVDADRIGLWGLGHGGRVALEAAATGDPAFAILVSPPLVNTAERLVHAAHHTPLPEDDARDMLEAIADTYEDLHYELALLGVRAQVDADAPSAEPDAAWPPELDSDYAALLDSVAAPTLLVFGTEDPTNPVARTLERIESLPDPGNREVVLVPGADHVLRRVDLPAAVAGALQAAPDAMVYLAALGHWLARTTD